MTAAWQHVFSAERVSEILTAPGEQAVTPTPEQRRMIEHPPTGSVLVVAGAGSGKTETMANRVVWLIANGLVEPAGVLGLTFTRKAAGELGERIARRLSAFTQGLTSLRERGVLSFTEAEHADRLDAHLSDGLELPEVSTYNSFAAGIVQEFGVFAGMGTTATLIDEAAAWRLAREVVCTSDDPELPGAGESIETLVKRVLQLDHAVADNLTDFESVERVVQEFLRVGSLPRDEQTRGTAKGAVGYADIRKILTAVGGTQLIARLAREFAAEKRSRGVLEFSDQLRLAVQTVQGFPDAIKALRARTPIVLLDEVQDTSVGQTTLLSALFKGQAVMAVGDPNQSIYGWRGASAENLGSFHRDFGGIGDSGAGATLSLSVSWRNPAAILHAANTVARPLNEASSISVPNLRSREEYLGTEDDPGAVEEADSKEKIPQIDFRFPETIDEEFRDLAQWLREAREQHQIRTGREATAAVIFRSRARMPAVSAALDAAGVPNRIVGVGGLLSTPEVTDLLAALRCIWYADAGSDLIRLLVGPRFSVGVADVAGLKTCARWFADRDISQHRLEPEDVAPDRALRDPDREFTLLDALDEIAGMTKLEHVSLRAISVTGRERLREAGVMLRSLRRGSTAGVPELIRATIEALRLDIELEANESLSHEGGARAQANLDAFQELVEGFILTDAHGTLPSVLAWLERVRELDQEAEHVPEPAPGTVQLITVHGSKGLEWDLVAVPRLVTQEFPLKSKEGLGWLRRGELPDELRKDASARPRLQWRLATTQAELREEIGGLSRTVNGEKTVTEGYVTELAEQHEREERRLAYVAITRAASRLLLTGSFWSGQREARTPSPYLQELTAAGIIAGLPVESSHTEDPDELPPRTLAWPLDPLGARGPAVLSAAKRVNERIESADHEDEAGIDATVRLLLAERAEAHSESANLRAAVLPERVTASTFHEFVEDPQGARRRHLRPLPQQPFRRTRTGNRFHEWVERRSSTMKGREVPLFALSESADPEFASEDFDSADLAAGADAELEALIENFNRSRWAELRPTAVEQELTLPFAGRRLVCKLDAVYESHTAAGTRYEIVDWKTGRPPKNAAERASRLFQLDLYRHAWALWANIDPIYIDATLFYVADAVEVRNAHPRTLEELETIWNEAAGAGLATAKAEGATNRGLSVQSPAAGHQAAR